MSIVIPTRQGEDLLSWDEVFDGHIRIETYGIRGTEIYVDIFDSTMINNDEAQVISVCFPYNDEGAHEATAFLQRRGFRVAVLLR